MVKFFHIVFIFFKKKAYLKWPPPPQKMGMDKNRDGRLSRCGWNMFKKLNLLNFFLKVFLYFTTLKHQ